MRALRSRVRLQAVEALLHGRRLTLMGFVTVVELAPAGGWYTEILAPWTSPRRGKSGWARMAPPTCS